MKKKSLFEDGANLETGVETMYLGNELSTAADIKNRNCTHNKKNHKTWLKLKPYWKVNNKKRQTQFCDAIMRSKVLHGLKAVQFTKNTKTLNAFQMRGLRQIMKKTHTY